MYSLFVSTINEIMTYVNEKIFMLFYSSFEPFRQPTPKARAGENVNLVMGPVFPIS